MRTRTLAREAALQYLYEVDLVGIGEAEPIETFVERQVGRVSSRGYAVELARGVLDHIEEIDVALARTSENWSLERMAIVDRNILRLGAYELLFGRDVPPKVALNEAIDLAHRFSSGDAGAFVNGILDRVRILGAKAEAVEETEECDAAGA